MKRLLLVLLALTFVFTFSTFAAENGENVFDKVWDSSSDDLGAAGWHIEDLGDLDQDGHNEFVVCTDENGMTFYVYEATGNNTFEKVFTHNVANCTYSYVMATGDLDGNGQGEIIAGVKAGTPDVFGIHIFEWDGVEGSDNYTFQTAFNVGDSSSVTAMDAGDFDGDGVQELFIAETERDDIYIMSLDTTSSYAFPSWKEEFHDELNNEADYSPWGFTSGDFDGDEKMEMATVEWDYNGLIVIQADTVDTYTRELWWDDMTHPNDGSTLRSLGSEDLDGDGFTEILLPSTNGNLYIVNNFGTFEGLDTEEGALDSVLGFPKTAVNGAAMGDQDMYFGSDGPDLYVTGDSALYDYEFDGDDYSVEAGWTRHELSYDTGKMYQDAQTGDWDGDGQPEVAVVLRSAPYLEVWEHAPLTKGEFSTNVTEDSSAYTYQIRGAAAGSDLDQDGKKEVFITDYRGPQIHGFEAVDDNTLEWVWSSDTIQSEAYAPNRNVVTGDMDNDGIGEVIFAVQADPGDIETGVQIYEWDGETDNGYNVKAEIPLDELSDDRWRFEQIDAPADVDGDGDSELLLANNGNGAAYDKLYIISVDGTFESGFYTPTIEGSWNKEEHAFGGSPMFGSYGDLDGDGTHEVVFGIWDNGGLFIVDVTGADTYEFKKYIYADVYMTDDVAYAGLEVADYDGDGRDEVMNPLYGTYYNTLLNIDGSLDDASEDDVHVIRGAYKGSGLCGATSADFDNDGKFEFYSPNYFSHTYEFDFTGTDPNLPEDWEVKAAISDFVEDDAYGPFACDAADDLDGDGQGEIVVGYLESFAFEPQVWMKIAEFTGETFVQDEWRIVTPEDYKLSQNYPNPFNPTTEISYTIPLAKNVSITIYDMLGREVKTLVNEKQTAGTYKVMWNGLDNSGNKVSSGTYFYRMKAGHIVKTKSMTLVK